MLFSLVTDKLSIVQTDFSEFIEIKSPYRWFLKLNESPTMVNYDKIEKIPMT